MDSHDGIERRRPNLDGVLTGQHARDRESSAIVTRASKRRSRERHVRITHWRAGERVEYNAGERHRHAGPQRIRAPASQREIAARDLDRRDAKLRSVAWHDELLDDGHADVPARDGPGAVAHPDELELPAGL